SLTIRSSFNPSCGAHPTILSTLSARSPLPERPVYLYYNLPPLLFVGIHELAFTMLGVRGQGSWELEILVHVLPLSGEPVEPLTRLAPSNDTWQEVLLPIHTRYAGSLGESLTLSFEGRRLFSCECDERMQNPWALVTRRLLAFDSPNAQQLEGLEIQVPVGDRQGDLQVVEPGTAFMVLLC
ncbi:hypothetical protein BKA70DRAFT_1130959, partial [Coprinopsis sp. MPI-PUGE-AT-0042]